MKVASYLCNIYDNTTQDSWQHLSESNIRNYFDKYDIPLNVIRSNDDRVKLSLAGLLESGRRNWKNNVPINKIYRIYDFLESDNDYGVFIDLDTIIINRNVDIRNCIRKGDNYLKCDYYGTIEEVRDRRQKLIDNSQKPYHLTYFLNKMNFAHSRFPNATHRHMITNTGFSVLNKDFCQSLVNFLDENKLNFNKKEDILSYYNNYPLLWRNARSPCNDEFLIEAYLRYDPDIVHKLKNHDIKHEGQEKILCTDSGGKNFEDHTMQYFVDQDPLFHHILREKNREETLPVVMRMFEV